ncbi:MAG TPA: CAP domain-containing protein [Candidatus Diapherotrites archaeon]|uniref:CAP domain-containing protein n=1 Tax=Candidatus Iainarchaeum sp. TaxID=3101447 RepID=A0A7J4IXJ7_9ARCH|nr:CAP domain-containing protein [Candidatus Diapherotrites archaeon]
MIERLKNAASTAARNLKSMADYLIERPKEFPYWLVAVITVGILSAVLLNATFTHTYSGVIERRSNSGSNPIEIINNIIRPPGETVVIGDDGESSTAYVRELEKRVHFYINQQRIANAKAPFEYDEALADIARLHSAEMAQYNYLSHTNRQGQGPTERAKAAGYPVAKTFHNGWVAEAIGEDAAYAYAYSSASYNNGGPYNYNWKSVDALALEIVDRWMVGHAPHRNNLLSDDFEKEGIGIAISGGYKVFVTQDMW